MFAHDKNGARVEFDYPAGNGVSIQLPGQGVLNDGSIQINWFLKFDGNGNRISEEAVRTEGTHMYKNVYSYDSHDRKTEMFHYARDKEHSTRFVYRYDDKGSISEVAHYSADGSLKERHKYNYDYDSTGNWVRRVSAIVSNKDGNEFLELEEATYRTITYFH